MRLSRYGGRSYEERGRRRAASAALPDPNIGGGKPESLLEFVEILQEGRVRVGVLLDDYDFEGRRELVRMQHGDVAITYADSSRLEAEYGFVPQIPLRETIRDYCEMQQ